jgi:hypothetical protein
MSTITAQFTNGGGATYTTREVSITVWNIMEQSRCLQMVVWLRTRPVKLYRA